MTLVKDTSYREIPFSEIPNEDYHQYLSLEKLVAKTSKHQHSMVRCRAIGVLTSCGPVYTLHDIENSSIKIRVSLRYLRAGLPYAARPFTAQLFGFVHWHQTVGPVFYATIVKDVLPPLAQKLSRAMEWIADNHSMLNLERDKED